MRLKVICLFLLLVGSVASFAQEGHPLVGTWYGDWGPTPTHRNQITVVMSWDGKNIAGIINPGPDVVNIKAPTLVYEIPARRMCCSLALHHSATRRANRQTMDAGAHTRRPARSARHLDEPDHHALRTSSTVGRKRISDRKRSEGTGIARRGQSRRPPSSTR